MINRYLFSPVKHELSTFILTILFGLAQALAILCEYYMLAKVMALVVLAQANSSTILPYLFFALLALMGRVIFEIIENRLAKKYTSTILQDFRKGIITKLKEKSNFNQQNLGKLYNLLDNGVERLSAYYSGYLPQLMKGVFIPVLFLCFVFPRDIRSGIIMLLTIFLIPFFMILIGKLTEKISKKQWKLISSLSAYLKDILFGIETLKVIGRSKEQYNKILSFSQSYAKATIRVQRFAFLSAFVLELIGTMSIAILAVSLGLRLVSGEMDYEVAFFILLLAPDYYQPMRQLGIFFHTSLDADATSEDIQALLDEEEEIIWGNETLGEVMRLDFNKVSYNYPNSKQNAIDKVSFSLNRNEMLALIGASGSGKSTIMSILLGEIKPQQGEILVNGKSIYHYTKESYLKEVAYVAQKPILVKGSIMDNIMLYSDKKEDSFLKNYQNLFLSLPDGFNTQVGEDGISLSGGQTALVSLARVANSSKKIIFLDEPTSEIDLQTEAILVSALPELLKNKLSVIIAHRFTTINKADKVILLEEGRVVAYGKFDQLQKTNAFLKLRGSDNV